MVIMNDKPRNPLMKFIKEHFKTVNTSIIIDNFMRLEIGSVEKLKELIKTDIFMTLEHSISNKKVEKIVRKAKKYLKITKKVAVVEKKSKKKVAKKVKKVKKTVGSVKDDCMNNTVAIIKKSAEYKSLPKSIGKSKLKKKELCNEISKTE